MAIRNEDILLDIYENASLEYQHRVPDPTKASLEDSMENMLRYSPIWNEFQHQLINRIGTELIRTTIWKNPLAEFKNPAMMFGSTIEEIKAGLIKARTYSADRDSLEGELFGQEPLNIETAFHSINRQDKYKLTMNEQILRRAFVNPTGLNKLVVEMMQAPANSDNWDEFVIMANLFSLYHKNNGFFEVNIPDVSNLDSNGADARLALRTVRAIAGEMKFLNTKYNAAGMPTAANPDELVIFATPKFMASMDVEALAGAFNVEKMELSGRMIPLPEDQFNIPGGQAVITTKDFFICNDTLLENRSQPNAAGLYTNFFFHHHGIYSASRFAPAVLLTSNPVQEVINVRVPATAVTIGNVVDSDGDAHTALVRGLNYQTEWTVTPENATDRTVIWSLTGQEDNRTRVDQNGIVHVAGTETATALTLTASLDTLDDVTGVWSTLTDTQTLTVTGDIAPQWPREAPSRDNPDTTGWVAATEYALGDSITLTGGAVVEVTEAGTSGSTEPVAPAIGGNVTDGTVVWTRIS